MAAKIFLVAVLSLSACVPVTLSELKQQGSFVTIPVENSYQAVFRDLVSYTDQCMKFPVQSILYTDIGRGELKPAPDFLGAKLVPIFIEVNSRGTTAEVSIWVTNIGAWRSSAKMVEKHLTDGFMNCEIEPHQNNPGATSGL